MSTFRGFIAIEIKPTPQLLTFEKEIEKTGADVKLVEPENIHITIKFLGDTDEKNIDDIERLMKDSVQGIKPFSITLQGTGVFPNQKYIKVLWIGIKDNGTIGTIAQMIDEKLSLLGYKKEKRDFSPHLTIGRVRTARNKEPLLRVIENHASEEFTNQNIHVILLKKSELTPKGPIYTTLREVPL
jgi:2'-5' RNA ligase